MTRTIRLAMFVVLVTCAPACRAKPSARLTFAPAAAADDAALQRDAAVLSRRFEVLRPPNDVRVEVRSGRVVIDAASGDPDLLDALRASVGRTGDLEFALVDDDRDPLKAATGVPSDLELGLENAPVGPGSTLIVHNLRTPVRPGESDAIALARLRAFAGGIALPPGDHFAFGRDVDEGAPSTTWWRTFLLQTPAALSGELVNDAAARHNDLGWTVAIELTPAAGSRFEAFTAANVRRRFAIVVDGIVYSAPVVQAKIGGGHAQITMGKGPPAQQEHDAKELAAVVRAGALPVPLVFEKLERIPP